MNYIDKNSVIVGIVMFAVGAIAGTSFISISSALIEKSNHVPIDMTGTVGTRVKHTDMGKMVPMGMDLSLKTGDDFDREFLTGMISHHKEAVSMAKYAEVSAKHDEIKKLAKDIIAAQDAEIIQMKIWESMWYKK
jgi:uncharacterized protein (DUF305 family)